MKRTWTKRDGTKIKIKDMSTNHIKNCIKMLENNGFIRESLLDAYSCEGPSGEMAEYFFEQEQMNIFMSPVSAYLEAFDIELEKRNL